MIQTVIGIKGDLVFDPTKSDGSPSKLMNVSRMTTLNWQTRIGLQCIAQTYASCLENAHRIRGPENPHDHLHGIAG